jgi:hypothetical protein
VAAPRDRDADHLVLGIQHRELQGFILDTSITGGFWQFLYCCVGSPV